MNSKPFRVIENLKEFVSLLLEIVIIIIITLKSDIFNLNNQQSVLNKPNSIACGTQELHFIVTRKHLPTIGPLKIRIKKKFFLIAGWFGFVQSVYQNEAYPYLQHWASLK